MRTRQGRTVLLRTRFGDMYAEIHKPRGKRASRRAIPGIRPDVGQGPIPDERGCERYPSDREIDTYKEHQQARYDRKCDRIDEENEELRKAGVPPEERLRYPKRPPFASWLVSEAIGEIAPDSAD